MLILSLGHVPLSWDFMNLFPGSLVVVVREVSQVKRDMLEDVGLPLRCPSMSCVCFFVEGLTHALTQVAFFQAFLEPQKKRNGSNMFACNLLKGTRIPKDLKQKQHPKNHPPKLMVGILDKIYKRYKPPNFCIFPLFWVTRIWGHQLIFMKLGPKPRALWRQQTLREIVSTRGVALGRSSWDLLM